MTPSTASGAPGVGGEVAVHRLDQVELLALQVERGVCGFRFGR